MNRQELAGMIDHTYLKLHGDETAVARICLEAMKYEFASVAILPSAIPFAAKLLRGSNVKVDAALSFFRGRYPLSVKLLEIEEAMNAGAQELDLVMSVSLLKEGRIDALQKEFEGFAKVAGGLTTKIILETSLLEDDEKVTACELAKECGLGFVKTSTGLKGGATVADIRLMRKTVGPGMGVKASGGIRSLETAIEMVQAGANRLGTSSGVAIVEAFQGE